MGDQPPKGPQAQGYPPVGEMGEPWFQFVLRTWTPSQIMTGVVLVGFLGLSALVLLLSFLASVVFHWTAQWFQTVFPFVTLIAGAMARHFFPEIAKK